MDKKNIRVEKRLKSKHTLKTSKIRPCKTGFNSISSFITAIFNIIER